MLFRSDQAGHDFQHLSGTGGHTISQLRLTGSTFIGGISRPQQAVTGYDFDGWQTASANVVSND